MRVLMISGILPTLERPGSLAPVARQIESIRRMGHSVTTIEIKGADKIKYLQALPRVIKHARDADVVHAHFGYSGWIALAQRQCPVVISFMGNDLLGRPLANGRRSMGSKIAIRLNRFAAEAADAVIVKSSEMAGVLEGVKTHVIPNGVDVDVFTPMDRSEARRQLGWRPDGWLALFPGNPAFPNKGYAVAQEAVALAAATLGRPIELKVLWGVGPEQVPVVMSACDVMVLASQTEGSPNVVKEALACELPIVATRVGDVPDLLGGVVGCQLCLREPGPMSRGLGEVIGHGRLKTGRTTLRERRLDQASVAKRVIAVYDEALATRRGQA